MDAGKRVRGLKTVPVFDLEDLRIGEFGHSMPPVDAADVMRQLREVEQVSRDWSAYVGEVGGETIEEETMATTIRARSNPYRRLEDREGEMFEQFGALTPAPRRCGEQGPGLLASDLERMVRAHYHDGFAAAEAIGEKAVEEMRGRLAEVFDEGYTAGRVERAHGLAGDFRSPLFASSRGPEPVCPRCETNRQDYCDADEGLDTPDCPECLTAMPPSWRTADGRVFENHKYEAAAAHAVRPGAYMRTDTGRREPPVTVGRYGAVHSWTLRPLPWWHWRSLWRRLRRGRR